MDPNANLQDQLALATSIAMACDDNDNCAVGEYNTVDTALAVARNAERLAELVLALDSWVTKGGFLPARWTR